MLAPAVLCHKDPARAYKAPYYALDARVGSLWHKTAGEANPRINPRHRGGLVWYMVDTSQGEFTNYLFLHSGAETEGEPTIHGV